MNTSPETDKLDVALSAFQKELPKIKKGKTAKIPTKTGGSYSYKYADFADVMEAAIPILAKHDLHLTQGFVADRLQTQVHHISGQWKGDDGLPLPIHQPPQELGAAITYFRRYGACTLLGIAPEGDDIDAAVKAEKQVPKLVQQASKFIPKLKADLLRSLLVERKVDPAAVRHCLQEFGFMSCAEITLERYDDVRDALEGL